MPDLAYLRSADPRLFRAICFLMEVIYRIKANLLLAVSILVVTVRQLSIKASPRSSSSGGQKSLSFILRSSGAGAASGFEL